MPYATIEGELVTVHDIRNFQYRRETDFTAAYYDETFDLRRLESVDLVAAYWMRPHIAHTFLTFGCGGEDFLAISIEVRNDQGEGDSAIDDFFRHDELFYVVADERDVIGVRAIHRQGEDVYLSRILGRQEADRRVFLDYMRETHALRERPEWYDTLTTHCTSAIWMHTRVNRGYPPLS